MQQPLVRIGALKNWKKKKKKKKKKSRNLLSARIRSRLYDHKRWADLADFNLVDKRFRWYWHKWLSPRKFRLSCRGKWLPLSTLVTFRETRSLVTNNDSYAWTLKLHSAMSTILALRSAGALLLRTKLLWFIEIFTITRAIKIHQPLFTSWKIFGTIVGIPSGKKYSFLHRSRSLNA